MARSYKFCVIQFPAHPLRDERLNLGLAVFQDERLDVRATRRFDKLKAISAALDVEDVRQSVTQLEMLDEVVRRGRDLDAHDRHGELAHLAAFQLSALGEFFATDVEAYERQIHQLLTKLVEPEPARVKSVHKRSTGLLRSVKSALKIERVLAKKGEGLEAHRVIANHQIAEGLSADLLLQNGAMHIVETVDASTDEGSLKRAVASVAISALVFEQARMSFGEQRTKAQLVYAASSGLEKAISPSLHAAEHQGARLVNWDSDDDRRGLITYLASLATPLESRKRRIAAIDASAQQKLRLN